MSTRRERILKFSTALALAACLALGWTAPAPAADTGKAKHVILIIGDGMQYEHERAGSRYLLGRARGLSFHALPFHGLMATWDVNTYNAYARGWDPSWAGDYDEAAFKPSKGYSTAIGGTDNGPGRRTGPRVNRYFQEPLLKRGKKYKPAATDSAAAATAMYTGMKTDAGNISWRRGDPADGALKTIAELMKEQKGASVGAVSTVPLTHATPAAVYAHNPYRKNTIPSRNKNPELVPSMAEQLAASGIEVAAGGGHPDWSKTFFTPKLLQAMKDGGDYVVVERAPGQDGQAALLAAAGQARAQGKKLLGLFGGKGGELENRMPAAAPGKPSVDRGSVENPTFAGLVTAALTVLSANPKGFFLMAEQGNLDWRNHSRDYKGMVGCVVDLHQGVQAALDFVDRPGDDVTWDNTLLIVTADHANSYMRIIKPLGMGELPPQQAKGSGDKYGPAYDSSSYGGYVTYGIGQHTNELVSLYAKGAGVSLLEAMYGQWYPGSGILDNTQLFWAMADAAGVKPPQPRLKPQP